MGGTAPLSGPIIVLAGGGMLGRAVIAALRARGASPVTADRPAFDLTSPASIRRAVDRPALVINCAAYTNVDGAEQSPDLAMQVNAAGVAVLARRCNEVDALLVHYSTDYVFDGQASGPYPPHHPKRPINTYGRSKSAGEDEIAASGADFLLLRTSWLYAPWGRNFVRTIGKHAAQQPALRVVNDQTGRPTSAEQLAETTVAMVAAGARGIHHATDAGSCTWFQFASAIVGGLALSTRIEPCTTADFPRPAARPVYSVLDTTSTDSLIGPRRPWTSALSDVLPRLEHPL